MDEIVLTDQATAAAEAIIKEHWLEGVPVPDDEALRALLAIAWIEGRAAGGAEAKAILRQMAAGLRGESNDPR